MTAVTCPNHAPEPLVIVTGNPTDQCSLTSGALDVPNRSFDSRPQERILMSACAYTQCGHSQLQYLAKQTSGTRAPTGFKTQIQAVGVI